MVGDSVPKLGTTNDGPLVRFEGEECEALGNEVVAANAFGATEKEKEAEESVDELLE